MTKQKRRGWAAAHQDLANTNRDKTSSRLDVPMAFGVDPATRLAAVQANLAKKRNNKTQPKEAPMDREQLISALSQMNDAERSQLLADVGDNVSRETKMATTAAALAGLVAHAQPKKGTPDAQ